MFAVVGTKGHLILEFGTLQANLKHAYIYNSATFIGCYISGFMRVKIILILIAALEEKKNFAPVLTLQLTEAQLVSIVSIPYDGLQGHLMPQVRQLTQQVMLIEQKARRFSQKTASQVSWTDQPFAH